MKRMRVCIFVANNCTVDSRVLRQAGTFARAGHDTIIVAVHRGDVPAVERRDGFEIRRVFADPTWEEGYPRLARIFGPILRPVARRASAPRPAVPKPAAAPSETHAAAPRGRISPVGWLRWLATGREPAPRAWRRQRSTPAGRVGFALATASRAVGRIFAKGARVSRVQGRRIRRGVRRRILRPTRIRQIDRRMAREASAFAADLYWANDVQTLRPATAAARKNKARVVYDAHEVNWDAAAMPWIRRRLWGLVERTHLKRMHRVFTVCDPIADVMASRYGIHRPTVILNCPRLADTTSAPPPERSPLNAHRQPGERIVLFHGSLSPWRGLEQLISAVPLLPQEYRLVILGHGAFRATLEDLVRSSGLNDRVTFLTSVPPAELPAWVVGADVGTIPYQRHGRNHEYSTPNKLFEYIHLGVPIVVNDLPEIRRIVNDIGFGIVTDCSDPASIAKAIQELVSDPERYRQMRDRARAAAPKYSWEHEEATILSALTG